MNAFQQLINNYSSQLIPQVISDVSAVEIQYFFRLMLLKSALIEVFSDSFSVFSKNFWNKVKDELNNDELYNNLKQEFVDELTNFFAHDSNRLVFIVNSQERAILTIHLDETFVELVSMEERFQITRLTPELNLLTRLGDFIVAEDCQLLYSQQIESNDVKAFLAFKTTDLCKKAGEVFKKMLKLSVGFDDDVKDLTKDIAKEV